MFLSHSSFFRIFGIVLFCLLGLACSTPPVAPVLSISEQILVDARKSQHLQEEFQRRVPIVSRPEIQTYLNKMVAKLTAGATGFEVNSVTVKIHRGVGSGQNRIFAFPGTVVYVPEQFLFDVEFENELAAAFAYSLAHVFHRDLAVRLEKTGTRAVLFGESSVFDFDREERKSAITDAAALLHVAKYDLRGLPSAFQRYPGTLAGMWNGDSDFEKKEVEFNIRESQKAQADYLPLRDPIVRSDDFILMKKGIMKNRNKKES